MNGKDPKKYSREHNKEERLFYIDLIEFLAILFVLLYHLSTLDVDFLNYGNMHTYFSYSIMAVLSTCVPLFFLVNGYLLFNKKFDLKKHVLRMIRLVVLTEVWGGITLGSIVINKHESISIKECFVTLWNLDGGIFHLWFMGALVCIYTVFPLLKLTYDKNKKIFIYFIFICALMTFGNSVLNQIGTVVLNLTTGRQEVLDMNWFNIFNIFRMIPGYAFVYFCIGGLMPFILPRLMKMGRMKLNACAGVCCILSTICLAMWGLYCSHIAQSVWDTVFNGYDTVFTLINTISIFLLCLNYNAKNTMIRNIIVTISFNTLGIYFLHPIFRELSWDYVIKLPFSHNIVGNLIYALVIMLICMIIILIVKKIPILKNWFSFLY